MVQWESQQEQDQRSSLISLLWSARLAQKHATTTICIALNYPHPNDDYFRCEKAAILLYAEREPNPTT